MICGAAALAALLPFVLLIIASFTDNAVVLSDGYSYFPRKWSLEAYQYLLAQMETIGRAYVMSIAVTAVGVICSLIMTSLFAYATSQNGIPGMKIVNFLLMFTMLFGGGMVSYYYVIVKYYHLRDTFWAQVFPGLLGAFNVILMRNYFKSNISPSLMEAARLDGASEFRIYSKVVMPLSLPINATIGLLTGLSYWNNWTNGLYFLTGRNGAKYYTLQNILNNINKNIELLKTVKDEATMDRMSFPSASIRMAIAVVGIVPMLILYPFFQKYFVKGITLGGVKE
ncbi:MAG: carbohydrate ABC transporter permease [Roseburia sp.]|nr:carbohydrate ABC transporter permease [Roseburia sp.]